VSFFSFYPPSSGIANASIGVNGDPIPLSSTLVAGEDPSGNQQQLKTNAAGDLLVEINTETTGLATAANQVLEITELTGIHSDTTSLDGKTVVVDTGNVTVVASALPAGASTEATLSAVQSAVDSLDTKTIAVDTGNVTVVASALPTGATTEATLSALNTKVTVIDTGAVTITSSALPTGAATEATLSTLQTTVTARLAGSLTPVAYDQVVQAYVGATTRLATVVFKLATVTVRTLTFTYDGSDRLINVVAA